MDGWIMDESAKYKRERETDRKVEE